MEASKKYGKNSRAKHLRNKAGKWTKRMANSRSRTTEKMKLRHFSGSNNYK
jgi:hypothetical protein